MAGYYYKLVVDIRTKNGYEFPIIDTGTIQPNVSATVNGYYATVIKAYDQDVSRYITVEYNFGECNDSVIETIVIENVTTPVAGEKPTYSASIRGSGYYIDTNKNASYDAYWKNPPEKWPYIKNGIGWYDVTKGDWIYSHESFIPGHEYMVYVYLKTEDGFTFAHSKWYEPLFTASINGYSAKDSTSGSSGLYEQTISASFSCEQKAISTVIVNMDEPLAGKTPADCSISVGYPSLYTADSGYGIMQNGVYWYDADGNMMDADEPFVPGQAYKAEIKIVPAKSGNINVSRFVSPLTATINGKTVVPSDDWDAVYVSSGTVYIYYTFEAVKVPVQKTVIDAMQFIRAIENGYAQAYPTKWAEYDLDSDGSFTVNDAIALIKQIVG